MRARSTDPWLVAGAMLSLSTNALAQSASDAALPSEETVQVEDVLRPRAGRAPLSVQSEPAAPVAIGLSDARVERADLGPRFGAERDPVRCRAPCTMHLRSGAYRVSFDADTPYPWSVDLSLGAEGARYVFRPHRVGYSALGGAMFILGCAGSLLGPGVIIVNIAVGDPAQLGWAILGGSAATVVGVGLLVGGWFTVREGAPRVWRAPSLRAFAHPWGAGVSGVF